MQTRKKLNEVVHYEDRRKEILFIRIKAIWNTIPLGCREGKYSKTSAKHRMSATTNFS
jgi:hypothetical protein